MPDGTVSATLGDLGFYPKLLAVVCHLFLQAMARAHPYLLRRLLRLTAVSDPKVIRPVGLELTLHAVNQPVQRWRWFDTASCVRYLKAQRADQALDCAVDHPKNALAYALPPGLACPVDSEIFLIHPLVVLRECDITLRPGPHRIGSPAEP